jgi:hypothetical protein
VPYALGSGTNSGAAVPFFQLPVVGPQQQAQQSQAQNQTQFQGQLK